MHQGFRPDGPRVVKRASIARVDRLAERQRPEGPAQGTQRWHRLLFSHWEVPAEALRPLVHERLTLDTFEGRCFVGAVAFTMQHVQPLRWAPRVPTATEFFEVNLRTYVQLDGGQPGVWFFSLDATSALAAWAARTFWHLPYWHAAIASQDDGERVAWRCHRRRPVPAEFEASFRVGLPLPRPLEGSLEFFLVERYRLYAARRGKLLSGQVHHAPYPLHQAHAQTATDGLLRAVGLTGGARTPDYFSPGVDVEMFPLRPV
ncbi:MAG: DUF2071 domain-containing protein [Myxococcaceae bacterium]|nr:DUF2071 domain-containing protein [Myxococcaceae bacterium]